MQKNRGLHDNFAMIILKYDIIKQSIRQKANRVRDFSAIIFEKQNCVLYKKI